MVHRASCFGIENDQRQNEMKATRERTYPSEQVTTAGTTASGAGAEAFCANDAADVIGTQLFVESRV